MFYDKTIGICEVQTETNAHGQISRVVGDVIDTFKGNARFNNLDEIRQMNGIEQKIDVAFTTDYDATNLEVVEFRGIKYDVVVIENDSHYLLLGTKCLSKSSTSPSA